MNFRDGIFNIRTEDEFKRLALELFNFQFEHNPVYRSYCDLLYIHPSGVQSIQDVPFLPISFFKSHEILSDRKPVQKTFSSSGTTGSQTSKHHITDLRLYEKGFRKAFEIFYGNIKDYVILALLPSYLERSGSSLIYMVDKLIQDSTNEDSGYFLNNYAELAAKLEALEAKQQKTLLLGVSFALLDIVESFRFKLNHTIVMETGGMKGRRKELIRKELHEQLCDGFGVNQIHSEYGMTELLSQAYSAGSGIFKCPPWMKVLIRDPQDALSILGAGQTGGLNIIDLANINSCAFIATQDLGKVYPDGQFEVIGRFDHSDVRGCNLMVL